MKDERLEAMRQYLLQTRESLYCELRQKVEEAASLRDEGVADVGDQGLSDDLRDFLHLLSDAKREEIVKIDEALDRIEKGDYGLCQSCGEFIPYERIEIRPYTRFCVACKETLEKEETLKGGAGRGTL